MSIVEQEFEMLARDNDMPLNKYWCDDGTENQYENHETSDAYNFYRDGWNKASELAQNEACQLKKQLARYQDPNYVLVPRKPTSNTPNNVDDFKAFIQYQINGSNTHHEQVTPIHGTKNAVKHSLNVIMMLARQSGVSKGWVIDAVLSEWEGME